MTIEELKNSLLAAPKNGYTRLSAADRAEMEAHARGYAAFIDACKTEREAVSWAVDTLKARGFVELVPGMSLKPGDRVYRSNRGKSLMAAVIGSESMNTGARICAAHIDSPRMDLKPNPLYEDSGLAFLKTHYYGGIKKYQWVTVPMALHGVVCRKDGTSVTITIGEDENDPILMITDLLPHLAADQMQKTAATAIVGEQLNVLLGSEPLEGEGSDLVKLHMMKLLNEKYGIIEADFQSAELTVVPAGKCREVGFDRSLLAAYGHDDRVCSYAEIEPLLQMG
ncbi:MAG: aminopeptidase, partial [Oscillospiraceae bacterium]|nr:aminopeptidase [Oscillospiraceae bacterium]